MLRIGEAQILRCSVKVSAQQHPQHASGETKILTVLIKMEPRHAIQFIFRQQWNKLLRPESAPLRVAVPHMNFILSEVVVARFLGQGRKIEGEQSQTLWRIYSSPVQADLSAADWAMNCHEAETTSAGSILFSVSGTRSLCEWRSLSLCDSAAASSRT